MNTIQSKEAIVNQLTDLIAKGKKLCASSDRNGMIKNSSFEAWRAEILTIIRYSKLDVSEYVAQITNSGSHRLDHVMAVNHTLQTIIDQINNNILCAKKTVLANPDVALENIFNRFHKVARQLRTRHNSRTTLEINDEYDVQDLLHALLLLHFQDVRPEEWTPSYAGGSLRIDFLLKDEGIVIEVKKTRASMTAKTLGEELLIDKEKYKEHPDCKKMYCFVYDPEGLLGNPVGIKRDLEKGADDFIKVFIRPE